MFAEQLRFFVLIFIILTAMKKFLIFAFAALCLASCSYDVVTVQESNRKVLDFQINQNEWKYSDQANNNFFMATFNMPEMTPDIYDNGTILVYRELDWGTSNAVQQILPYSRHHEYQVGASTWAFFTETVDFEYGVGFMNIVYTASDFDYELNNTFVPETMHFRVVITW